MALCSVYVHNNDTLSIIFRTLLKSISILQRIGKIANITYTAVNVDLIRHHDCHE